MVISYKYSSGDPGAQYSRDMSYQMIQEFTHRYISRNNTIESKDLLLKNDIDFTNHDEMKNLREKEYMSLLSGMQLKFLKNFYMKKSELKRVKLRNTINFIQD